MNKIEEITERKKKRFQFLDKLYDLSGCSTRGPLETNVIDEELGFDKELSKNIVDYLIGEGLIKEITPKPHTIAISQEGINKVETAYIEQVVPIDSPLPVPIGGAARFAP